ncbi:MAG: hypothetical protein R3F46_12940 [bacterium]
MDWLVNESDTKAQFEYPVIFFSGDQQLARLEFAEAAIGLQDKLDWNDPEKIRLLAEMLSVEFFEEVSLLSGSYVRSFESGIYGYSYDPANWKVHLDLKLRWEYGASFPLIQSESTSAYAEVPITHWAYDAVRYFIDSGYLEGYPKHFFCRDRTFTRYEFAQAIARLLDTMSNLDDPDPYDIQITECLRGEFSDILNSLSSRVDTLGLHILDMKVTMDDLAGTVSN